MSGQCVYGDAAVPWGHISQLVLQQLIVQHLL